MTAESFQGQACFAGYTGAGQGLAYAQSVDVDQELAERIVIGAAYAQGQ